MTHYNAAPGREGLAKQSLGWAESLDVGFILFRTQGTFLLL